VHGSGWNSHVQSERLRETVERVYFNVPYYRNKMQEAGLGPESIQSIDDIVNYLLLQNRTLEIIILLVYLLFL
jgi:phenylacetate-coenzyme A ligase PaaK-like adenylate-forming protein